MIVEGAGRADMTRTTSPEANDKELAVRFIIGKHNLLMEMVLAFVKGNIEFLSEGRITSIGDNIQPEDIIFSQNGPRASVHWLDHNWDDELNRSTVHFPIEFLWNEKAFNAAKGHYELRKVAKAEREQERQDAIDRANFERLKAMGFE